jgi:hypothetical protein
MRNGSKPFICDQSHDHQHTRDQSNDTNSCHHTSAISHAPNMQLVTRPPTHPRSVTRHQHNRNQSHDNHIRDQSHDNHIRDQSHDNHAPATSHTTPTHTYFKIYSTTYIICQQAQHHMLRSISHSLLGLSTPGHTRGTI